MKIKRLWSLLLAAAMLAGSLAALSSVPFLMTASAAEVDLNAYVSNGLVSFYSGTQNSRTGHNTSATVWQDLKSNYDMTIQKNAQNYFTSEGLLVQGTKHDLPSQIVDLVNGQEFTVELLFSDFVSTGTTFNTFLNSQNDNFALFRRLESDQIEFKFAGNSRDARPTVNNGLALLQKSLITITYKVGGNCTIYINGNLMVTKSSPSAMGANDLFIGHDDAAKTFSTTYRAMRFYNRALTAAEVQQNGKADGVVGQKGSYIQNGLVSAYDIEKRGSSTTLWEDTVGNNDMTMVSDADNYFTAKGYHHTGAINKFPQAIVDVINGGAFTVEIRMSDLSQGAAAYCTIMSSTNDHFALFRRNATDQLEYKFANNAASNRNTVSGCLSLLQDALITITYRVGGDSRIYINGQLQSSMSAPNAMTADDLFFGHSQADRYFTANFQAFRFYNRELTMSEVKYNAEADGFSVPASGHDPISTPGYVTVAQPVTRIVGDVSCIREVNSAAEMAEMMRASSKLPAIAIFRIDDKLNVLDKDGAAFSTVSRVLTDSQFKVIPAFYVTSSAATAILTTYLKEIGFFDCFVVSNNPVFVKQARIAAPSISGAIDFCTAYAMNDSLSDAQCAEIRRIIKEYYGHIALLPADLCNQKTIQYLFDRQVNTWVGTDADADTPALYDALLSGAVGVVSDDTATLLDIACNKLDSKTITRTSANAGHRGIPSKAPENTIEGSLLAYQLGANVIELDIHLTSDGQVVVMHDDTTERTCNGNMTVAQSTLAQLKTLYVNKGHENGSYSHCRIPTFEEYLQTFKDKDCILFIEIKTSNTAIVPAMKALIEKHDMYDQCTVITFYPTILQAMRNSYPTMHGGYLNATSGSVSGVNADAGMRTGMSTVGSLHASLNPSYSGYTEANLRAALRRGISIYPWTFRGDIHVYKDYFMWGYAGLTGDNADVLGHLSKSVAYTGKTSFDVGESLPLSFHVTNYLRNTTVTRASVTILAGEEYISMSNTAIDFLADGEVTLLLSYRQTIDASNSYTLYTQPITLTIGEGLPDVETAPDTEPETDGSTLDSEAITEEITDIAETDDMDESGNADTSVEETQGDDQPASTDADTAESDTSPADESAAGTLPAPLPPSTGGCQSVAGVSCLLLLGGMGALALLRRRKD